MDASTSFPIRSKPSCKLSKYGPTSSSVRSTPTARIVSRTNDVNVSRVPLGSWPKASPFAYLVMKPSCNDASAVRRRAALRTSRNFLLDSTSSAFWKKRCPNSVCGYSLSCRSDRNNDSTPHNCGNARLHKPHVAFFAAYGRNCLHQAMARFDHGERNRNISVMGPARAAVFIFDGCCKPWDQRHV